MILEISKHIRYIFTDSMELVPLSRELDHIENYIEMQRGSSQYPPVCRFDIDPRLRDLPIPPLSLQSFVENCVKYFSVASGGGTGRTLHPDNMAAGPASYGMTDTMGRMHSDAQFAGSSSVPAHVEMMGFLGMGNNPMVGATVAVAVAVEEAMK